MNKKAESVLSLSGIHARKFFFKDESYCNFDLPCYFKFNGLLIKLSKKLTDKNLSDFYRLNTETNKPDNPRNYENVNHKILNNKDGKYSWRPFQLIHPALYVELVHKLTEENNWGVIRKRFKEFSNNKIDCISIPLQSRRNSSDKSEQISTWWENVEQKSIELALDYQYVVETDITDCYGSIYTHSISWAIHGKEEAKSNRDDRGLIGNIIDRFLQDMAHGQTNGIPQGSVLMDFIAEILLGYADKLLNDKLDKLKDVIKDYHILRYRDDYRIFVNNPIIGDMIVKCLCEVFITLGLKLNPDKTRSSSNVIKSSIKSDKLYWIKQKQYISNLQMHLLIIHDLSQRHPNSGSLIKALKIFYKRITNNRKKINNNLVLISLIVDVAYNSPRAYSDCAAILSLFISQISCTKNKLEVIDKIATRFDNIPNTGHLQLWLQRISYNLDRDYEYKEILCKKVIKQNTQVWNSDWLNESTQTLINEHAIVDLKKIDKQPDVIKNKEVELFRSGIDYY